MEITKTNTTSGLSSFSLKYSFSDMKACGECTGTRRNRFLTVQHQMHPIKVQRCDLRWSYTQLVTDQISLKKGGVLCFKHIPPYPEFTAGLTTTENKGKKKKKNCCMWHRFWKFPRMFSNSKAHAWSPWSNHGGASARSFSTSNRVWLPFLHMSSHRNFDSPGRVRTSRYVTALRF